MKLSGFETLFPNHKKVITMCDNIHPGGVTMLASVLKSKKAIKVNIARVGACMALAEFA